MTDNEHYSNLNIKIFQISYKAIYHPTNIYLFKVNNRNTRKRSGLCSKFAIKTRHFKSFSSVSIPDFEQVKICWEV